MTSNRFDLYSDIHKALRTLLFEHASFAGRCNYDEEPELSELQSRFEFVAGVITEHAEHESRFVHPLLTQIDPEKAAHLDSDHEDHAGQLEALAKTLAAIEPSAPDVVARGNDFYRRFCEWTGEFLLHMNHEETVIMPALHEHYSDEELMATSAQLRAAIEPERMGMYLSKMIPAMNGAERSAMFQGMKQEAPPEVFEGTLQLAERILTLPAFKRLSQSLSR